MRLFRYFFAFCVASAALANAQPVLAVQPDSVTAVRMADGSVTDGSGAPVAGALVTVSSAAGVALAQIRTDDRGRFEVRLPTGASMLMVERRGFEPAIRSLDGPADALRDLRISLDVAALRETVQVVAPGEYRVDSSRTATKTLTPLRDVPQSISVVSKAFMDDRLMTGIGDVVTFVPGVMLHQGENNRDQVVIRGNSSSADFFVDGVRDDVQYFRDVYNLERVEVLKGPNALIFGRGGAGGVVNRVPKTATAGEVRDIAMQGGSFGHTRVTADVSQPMGARVAMRLNLVGENSQSFRSYVGARRFGMTPTVTLTPSDRTRVTLRYEFLNDARVADRGITSFAGSPVDVPVSTYYGDPDASTVNARAHLGAVVVERRLGHVSLRNHSLVAHYDRGYQNFVPREVTSDQSSVSLSAYNNATVRVNLFNQTDVTVAARTGSVEHTILAGSELGRQQTRNLRKTGYFERDATKILVPFASPTVSVPVVFRQSETDADNRVEATVAAGYLQDQVALNSRVQVLTGIRVDRFNLTYHNRRDGATLHRPDWLVSPRAGVVVKPTELVSLYASLGVSHLPGSGDQFSSLTTVTEQAKPERFRSYEAGLKWDAPRGLSVTTAIFRLDRTNTRATSPNDPTLLVQTGSQRTSGGEIGVNGRILTRWRIAGGYGVQRAWVTGATTAAPVGATVAQVPRHTLSLWNDVLAHPRLDIGLGLISRTSMFAAIDNSVRLPGFARIDASAVARVTTSLRLQLNVENVLNTRYYANADNNTNISPGSPRSVRVGVRIRF